MDATTNKIGLAGDWHGAYQWTRHALHTMGQAGIRDVFHLGDFSLGWPGKWPDLINICESVCSMYDMTLWITPGNHENWEWIDSRPYIAGQHWMTDHTVLLERNARFNLPYTDSNGDMQLRSFVSLGGATSVDQLARTRGIDWFPEEEMTIRDALQAARDGHADIMLCHDAPDGGTAKVQAILDTPPHLSMWPESTLRMAKAHRELLNMAFYGCDDLDGTKLEGVNPKVFAHGHMHAYDTYKSTDTLFLSLGCNNQEGNLMVLDLDTLEATELPIIISTEEIARLDFQGKRKKRLARAGD